MPKPPPTTASSSASLSSRPPDAATFVVLAEEVGLPFTADEVASAMAEGRELDDAELSAVAGGDGFCYLIGGSDEPEIECGYMGYMCAYVGVTS